MNNLTISQDGARGIHTAAMKGHVSVINTLLHRGENVDAVTNVSLLAFRKMIRKISRNIFQDNYTALHLAVEAGKSNVVEALLGHGAQVHIKGKIFFSLYYINRLNHRSCRRYSQWNGNKRYINSLYT